VPGSDVLWHAHGPGDLAGAARPVRRGGRHIHRHGEHLRPLGGGRPGRRERNPAGRLDESARQPRRSIHRQQGWVRVSRRRARAVRPAHRGRVRQEPAAAGRGNHRPVLRARRRPPDSTGRDAGGIRPAGAGGQGALRGRQQLHRLAAGRGASGQRGGGLSGLLRRAAALYLPAAPARRQLRSAVGRQRRPARLLPRAQH